MQNYSPWVKKRSKNPHPGHNLPSLNAKILKEKEHNSLKAVSFQIFHNCPFSFIGRIKYSEVFTGHLRLILLKFEDSSKIIVNVESQGIH